jgi:hypothetical protein
MMKKVRTMAVCCMVHPLWMQAVIILLCLTAVVPARIWAQKVQPSERLTRLLMPGTSTV